MSLWKSIGDAMVVEIL